MRFRFTLISELETNEEAEGEKTKTSIEDGKGNRHALCIPHVLSRSPPEGISISFLHNLPLVCEREEVVQRQQPYSTVLSTRTQE